MMSIKDGRKVKQRGYSRNSKRAYTKNRKHKGRSGNVWNKA
jgi:hypothetical protein